jgi:Rieske Fe-S protein
MIDESKPLPRRGFLKLINQLLAATGLLAIVGPVIAFFWPAELEEIPSEPKPIGAVGSLAQGESLTTPFGRYPALAIHTPEGELVAYSAVCTHFACLVKWNPESGMIECPCHEGFFDPRDGSVISGPPPEGLMTLRIFAQDGTLFIGGAE